MADPVSYASRGGVAVVTLDDGKANALAPSTIQAIHAALDRAEKEDAAVLLTGRPGRLSAGFDLGVMREGGPDVARQLVRSGAELAIRLARQPAPVVIACTGHALAMGAVLLMAGDLRVGARGDFKIGFNEVAIGMTTPIFLAELARERLSKRHLLRATVHAEIYSPETAVDAGFLDRTAAPERLAEEALQAAEQLAGLPRAAFVGTRRVLRGAGLERIEATLDENLARAFPGRAPGV